MNYTIKQITRKNKNRRADGYYLVHLGNDLVGSIVAPYHSKDFRAHTGNRNIGTFSTKQLAFNAIRDLNSIH